MDQEFIARFAKYANETQMRILLSKLNTDTPLTEIVLWEAARNEEGAGAMRQILRRQEHRAQVNEDVLTEVAFETSCSHALEMMEILLDEQQAGFIVTHKILCKAASLHEKDVFEILMNNGGLQIPIIEKLILCAVEANNDDVVSFLLDLEEKTQIDPLPITEWVLLPAMRNLKPATLKAILHRRPFTQVSQVSDKMFVKSCYNKSAGTLLLLLEPPHNQLPVMEMIQALKYHMRGSGSLGQTATRKVQALMDEMVIKADQELLEDFADNTYTLEFLLQRNSTICITEQAVIRAAAHRDALAILLDKRLEDIPMSKGVMVAIVEKAACSGHFAGLRQILTHFGSTVPITEKVLVAASATLDTLQLLLQSPGLNIPLPLPEKVVANATME
ncbi:uncharacterized protein N7483_006595 [Penicillium malachiteum]|uniref:uncharacterized protein n=1 Tax=Penicillium malachiteum TaxID=1324776 RepID=UPI002546F6FC|nr:uncharacterized protein N7483_006595 [Penicillium malachiteum]KAJ5725238.1 hypothetical protein N7483_006595 [Penicillium malachiteum]